jgi:hypothetical protein
MIRPARLGEMSSNLNAAIQTLWENGIAIPVSSFKAAAQLAAHNLHVQRIAAARLRAACKALEVDRGRRGRTKFVIALALMAIAPALAKPKVHHAVFCKALRAPKPPPRASVPWAQKTRVFMSVPDPCGFRRCQED